MQKAALVPGTRSRHSSQAQEESRISLHPKMHKISVCLLQRGVCNVKLTSSAFSATMGALRAAVLLPVLVAAFAALPLPPASLGRLAAGAAGSSTGSGGCSSSKLPLVSESSLSSDHLTRWRPALRFARFAAPAAAGRDDSPQRPARRAFTKDIK